MAMKSEKRKARLASAKRRLDEHKHGSRPSLNLPGGVPFFNPKDDAYTITVLPFKVGKSVKKFRKDLRHADPGDLYYEQSFFTHRDVGPDQTQVVCPAMTFGDPCPVCEERQRLAQDPKFKQSKEGKDAIAALRPKERQLFAVYDHDDRKKGVQLWEISPYNFGYNLDDKIKKSRDEVREAYMDFHDPDGGYDLRITGREKSMGPGTKPFNEFFVDEFIERKKPLDAKLLEKVPCLNDVPVAMDYEELSKLFFGSTPGGEDDDEDGEEDEKKGRRGKPSRNGRASAPDEDEDEDDTDEDDEGDDDDDSDEDVDAEIEVGDTVTGFYKGKKLTGTVKKIKGTLATVEVEGREKPWMAEADELAVFAGEEEEEEDEDSEDDDADEDDDDEPLTDEGDDDDEDTEEDDTDDEDDEDDAPPEKARGRKKPAGRKKPPSRR